MILLRLSFISFFFGILNNYFRKLRVPPTGPSRPTGVDPRGLAVEAAVAGRMTVLLVMEERDLPTVPQDVGFLEGLQMMSLMTSSRGPPLCHDVTLGDFIFVPWCNYTSGSAIL